MNAEAIAFPPSLTDATPFKDCVSIEIKQDSDAAFVSDRRQEIKTQLKEIEKTRKEFTEPLLESKKRIDAQAKRVAAPFEAIVRVLDGKLLTWHQSQEEIRMKEAARLRQEEIDRLNAQKQADLDAVMLGDEKAAEDLVKTEKYLERAEQKPIEITNMVKTTQSTTYVQQRWTFEVVNAVEVPRQFLQVNEVEIRKFINQHKEHAQIPGVRVFQESKIGGRS